MPEINMEQAMVPETAIILHNHFGTAPGLLIEKNKKVFCAMPGVPFEMKHMTEEQLLPYLSKRFKNKKDKKIILQKTLHTIGISESLLFEKTGDIDEITKSNKNSLIKLAFLPSNYETRIRINVEAKNKQNAEYDMKEAVNRLKKKVGRYIYSYNDEPIEKTVGLLLIRRGLTLSSAESCTGGLVASKITDVAGSSDYFTEGAVTYSNESKIKITQVKKATLKRYGAVSKQTAIEMANGIRKLSGSDIGISTTGIAGPKGATKNKPIGLVWIGYSDKDSTFAKHFIFTKDRLRNKEIMSKMALEIIRRKLLRINIDND
jgi:nicotinamide-nucleotide amidase